MNRSRLNRKITSFTLIAVILIIAGYFLFKDYVKLSEHKEKHSMEKVISKDGTVISFLRTGAGPALLLVHGTTADHTRWLPLIPYLEKLFTVYAMDRRGRGGSGDSPDYHLMKEVEDIVAVVNVIDGPVFLLGHSFGALTSLEAALHNDKITRMILYEPPLPMGIPLYPPGSPEKMQALIDSNKNEAALEVMLKEVVRMPDYEFEKYRQLPVYKRRIELAPTIPREITVELDYTFKPERFADMKIPVLLLLGGDSPAIFHESTKQVDAALPNSRIVIMPGQQHIAMDTNTELFIEEVKKFLLE